ncbi:hypothetical protein D3C79_850990 [compost metagenome]
MLLPAMGHFADQHEVGIDPGAAILQPRRQAVGAACVAGPHRRSQAVLRVVGPFQRLCFVGEARYRHHRAKHFVAHDLVILQRIGQHRWLEEEAIPR